jgi:oligoribonuclease
MSEPTPTRYAWFDTEFTSLDLDAARLIQVALVVTNADLEPIVPAEVPEGIPADCVMANGVNLYLPLPPDWQPQEFHLTEMADVLARCRRSSYLVSQADACLAAWIDATVGPCADQIGERPILAGNSIHNDWFLARRDLPEFARRLHYRLLDASGFKSEWLAHLGGPDAVLLDKGDHAALREAFPAADLSAGAHDAYFDAQASLAELAWYRARLRPEA